jgi:hypothetical protein
MSAAYRPIQADDSIILKWDKSITATEGISVTATNFTWAGGSNFTIQLPLSLSAHGGLDIQANNSNFIDSNLTGLNSYTYNPAFNQPSMGKNKGRAVNPSFSGNWVTIASINNGIAFRSINNVPVRFIRLIGAGLTANGICGYFWSEINSQGN